MEQETTTLRYLLTLVLETISQQLEREEQEEDRNGGGEERGRGRGVKKKKVNGCMERKERGEETERDGEKRKEKGRES